MNKNLQMSETFFLGALLTITGGFLDAYTYLLRGNVFANAQTGNIVLLGVHLAKGEINHALFYLLPILAFVLGILICELFRKKFQQSTRFHWRQWIVALEIILLFITGFLPSGVLDPIVNITISFICAMQVQCFQKINGNAFATTMCTGNLRAGTDALFQFMQTRDTALGKKSIQYYSIIVFFILGAALGVLAIQLAGIHAVWFCCVFLATVFALMFFQPTNT